MELEIVIDLLQYLSKIGQRPDYVRIGFTINGKRGIITINERIANALRGAHPRTMVDIMEEKLKEFDE